MNDGEGLPTLLLSLMSFNLLERLAETELNKLQKWINANKLTINFDPKSQVTNQETSACC